MKYDNKYHEGTVSIIDTNEHFRLDRFPGMNIKCSICSDRTDWKHSDYSGYWQYICSDECLNLLKHKDRLEISGNKAI